MAYQALILACDPGSTDVVKSLACPNHDIIDKYLSIWENLKIAILAILRSGKPEIIKALLDAGINLSGCRKHFGGTDADRKGLIFYRPLKVIKPCIHGPYFFKLKL